MMGGGRGGFGGGPGGGGRGSRADPLVGQTVRIIRGNNKGKVGMVKLATASTVTVELQATQKYVPVPRGDIQVVSGIRHTSAASAEAAARLGGGSGAVPGAFAAGGSAAAGAMPGARTPAYGAAGASSSAGGMGGVGAQTPAYGAPGGRTPGLGAGADASAGPASGYLSEGDNAVWYAPGVCVTVKAGSQAGKTGVVATVTPNGRSLGITVDGGGSVVIPVGDAEPLAPAADDYCRILRGGFAGTKGFVVSLTDENEYVVRCGEDLDDAGALAGDVEVFPVGSIVKCVA